MATYFSISLQFLWEDMYPRFMHDLYAQLGRSELRFLSGCYEAAEMTLADITAWNQRLLNQRFRLSLDDDGNHDYKQTRWALGDFTEVRAFIASTDFNSVSPENEFALEIIIPEQDILLPKDAAEGWRYRTPSILLLEATAAALWQFTPVRAIQTSLEGDEDILPLASLEAGQPPHTQPFAILPALRFSPANCGFCADALGDGRQGWLLREDA